MRFILQIAAALTLAGAGAAPGIEPPRGFVAQSGDKSIILHWERNNERDVAGYRVYHSLSNDGKFVLLGAGGAADPGYCDLAVTNGQTNFYYVTAITTSRHESLPSTTLAVASHRFTTDDEFLDYVQQACFDYFWYAANPANGLVPDRSGKGSPCSIAAVGFGLTAIGIGIDHGWITRPQGVERVLTTLNTFLNIPQGPGSAGTIGYKGWFYHFLDMNSALRYAGFNTELSSIDTALLLSGILYAEQYFSGAQADEKRIRQMADAIFNGVDWNWMARGTDELSMGWFPGTGFIAKGWTGYNEAMILYCLGLGASTNPLPASSWTRWVGGYTWVTNYGLAYVAYPSLFVHQYSHCWIDFGHRSDSYMRTHYSNYFENSRRATLANRRYCTNNPMQHVGYSSTVWGLTACDGPNRTIGGVTYQGYAARGAPGGLDDGTVAPTAAGGSIPFTPEYSIPTLRFFYTNFLRDIWTSYGFRDAFNLEVPWWDPEELGIDQGPIVIMIENYRTQRVWRLFMQNPEVERSLQRAGFVSSPSVPASTIDPFKPVWDKESKSL